MREIYYFFKNLFIVLFKWSIKVSLSCRIKAKTKNIGKNVVFCKKCYFDGSIGMYSVVGPDCRIIANIGNYCSIAPNVKTVSANHPLNFYSISPFVYKKLKEMLDLEFREDLGPVTIGHDVWIGENVLLKGGIKIGDGAVIGMGSIVVNDVEPYTIVAGCPAKVIRKRFDNETINKLVEKRWYENNLKDLNDKSFL